MKGDPLTELLKYCTIDKIPDFLGGENTTPLWQDKGPWNKYEIVDGCAKDDIVGIRLKDNGKKGHVFTPQDMETLPNYLTIKKRQHMSSTRTLLKEQETIQE